jgi:hypothetical protein
MTLAGEGRRDFVIGSAVAGKIEHPVTHLCPSREFGDGVDLQLGFQIAHSAATPDDPDQSDIVFASVENHFIHKTAQQRFALRIDSGWVRPDLWEASREADDLAMQGLAHPHLTDGLWRGLLNKRLLGWDYLRGNKLSRLVWHSYEAIVAACKDAWDFLVGDPVRIKSIAHRSWASVNV